MQIRDPGLQPERTQLAWRRTLLTVTAIALLSARLAAMRDAPLGVAVAGALWAAALIVGRVRSARLLVLVVIGYALLGAVLALLVPPPQ
jgi:hypothetical protein